MRNIIKVLLNEGIEREDIIAICKYIREEYTSIEETKSAKKEERKEIIYNYLNPNGAEVTVNNTKPLSKKEIEAKERLVNSRDGLGGKVTVGQAPTFKDFKTLTSDDRYSIRQALGRNSDGKFSKIRGNK